MPTDRRAYNRPYEGPHNEHVAFPLGGIGAGMVCIEGTGAFSHISLRHEPHMFHEPHIFAAISVANADGSRTARLLQGQVPKWKLRLPGYCDGARDRPFGLPRCREVAFDAKFPFARLDLRDPELPLTMRIDAWSPFTPGASDDSCLPVAGLEYTFRNTSSRRIEAVFSFHSRNLIADPQQWPAPKNPPVQSVGRADQGFVLRQDPLPDRPWAEGAVSISTDAPDVAVNPRWFRGGWFDSLTMVWKSIAEGSVINADPYPDGKASPGGSLYVPIELNPGESKTIRVRLAWYVPISHVREGDGRDDPPKTDTPLIPPLPTHRPWYAGRFESVGAVDAYFLKNYDQLRQASKTFADCFYDSTLPPEVIEAIAANLTILKSPTTLRQADGRLWLWEGCYDKSGSCYGSCTHVWNYAQAICHLFPDLERTLRDVEFNEDQDATGAQNFRSALPIRPNTVHHSAADGQLGGIMKVYRDWRTSGDTAWLARLWPKVKENLNFCITAWDPNEEGWLIEPHHNTYDIWFWGPNGMCTTFYAGALKAAVLIGEALNDPQPRYAAILEKSKQRLEQDLFVDDYFIHRIQWAGLKVPDPVANPDANETPEAIELLKKEGPKYQYGTGCLSDGVIGEWMADVCGVGSVLDQSKVRSHLLAVFKHNFKRDLFGHANPQRPTYALGDEAGLLLCSWPRGDKLSLPFPYSDEVWTGIEYQVAAHLILSGEVDKGLQVVRAVRDRYDGLSRNPFDEYECGHWYGRAQASYSLLQALTGQRYDAITKTLYLRPQMTGDFRSFLATATGYGTVGVKDGKAFVEVKHGTIDVREIVLKEP